MTGSIDEPISEYEIDDNIFINKENTTTPSMDGSYSNTLIDQVSTTRKEVELLPIDTEPTSTSMSSTSTTDIEPHSNVPTFSTITTKDSQLSTTQQPLIPSTTLPQYPSIYEDDDYFDQNYGNYTTSTTITTDTNDAKDWYLSYDPYGSYEDDLTTQSINIPTKSDSTSLYLNKQSNNNNKPDNDTKNQQSVINPPQQDNKSLGLKITFEDFFHSLSEINNNLTHNNSQHEKDAKTLIPSSIQSKYILNTLQADIITTPQYIKDQLSYTNVNTNRDKGNKTYTNGGINANYNDHDTLSEKENNLRQYSPHTHTTTHSSTNSNILAPICIYSSNLIPKDMSFKTSLNIQTPYTFDWLTAVTNNFTNIHNLKKKEENQLITPKVQHCLTNVEGKIGNQVREHNHASKPTQPEQLYDALQYYIYPNIQDIIEKIPTSTGDFFSHFINNPAEEDKNLNTHPNTNTNTNVNTFLKNQTLNTQKKINLHESDMLLKYFMKRYTSIECVFRDIITNFIQKCEIYATFVKKYIIAIQLSYQIISHYTRHLYQTSETSVKQNVLSEKVRKGGIRESINIILAKHIDYLHATWTFILEKYNDIGDIYYTTRDYIITFSPPTCIPNLHHIWCQKGVTTPSNMLHQDSDEIFNFKEQVRHISHFFPYKWTQYDTLSLISGGHVENSARVAGGDAGVEDDDDDDGIDVELMTEKDFYQTKIQNICDTFLIDDNNHIINKVIADILNNIRQYIEPKTLFSNIPTTLSQKLSQNNVSVNSPFSSSVELMNVEIKERQFSTFGSNITTDIQSNQTHQMHQKLVTKPSILNVNSNTGDDINNRKDGDMSLDNKTICNMTEIQEKRSMLTTAIKNTMIKNDLLSNVLHTVSSESILQQHNQQESNRLNTVSYANGSDNMMVIVNVLLFDIFTILSNIGTYDSSTIFPIIMSSTIFPHGVSQMIDLHHQTVTETIESTQDIQDSISTQDKSMISKLGDDHCHRQKKRINCYSSLFDEENRDEINNSVKKRKYTKNSKGRMHDREEKQRGSGVKVEVEVGIGIGIALPSSDYNVVQNRNKYKCITMSFLHFTSMVLLPENVTKLIAYFTSLMTNTDDDGDGSGSGDKTTLTTKYNKKPTTPTIPTILKYYNIKKNTLLANTTLHPAYLASRNFNILSHSKTHQGNCILKENNHAYDAMNTPSNPTPPSLSTLPNQFQSTDIINTSTESVFQHYVPSTGLSSLKGDSGYVSQIYGPSIQNYIYIHNIENNIENNLSLKNQFMIKMKKFL